MATMVTSREAIKQLRDAIATVRGACGADPNCRDLLKTLSNAEDEMLAVSYGEQTKESQPSYILQTALEKAEKAASQMFGPLAGDDDATEPPPADPKAAADRVRQEFARRRQEAYAGEAKAKAK